MHVIPDIEERVGNRVRFRLHPGQMRVMNGTKRITLVLAGTQGGKTTIGPHWLLKKIKEGGPGDYLTATPSFPLLELKALPEFRRLFEERFRLGTYRGSPSRVFTLSGYGEYKLFRGEQDMPTRIMFGHAQDPESLESATYKAAWLDEAGQKKFRRGSWEAIQRRLSIFQGPVLLTTTPYVLNWLKDEIYDKGRDGTHPDIDVINFESTMNPAFPQAEFDRMRAILPPWKFNMMYRGLFERPAGMIYGCFDRAEHVVPRFEPPATWPRFVGLDFGGANTAAVFAAREPETGDYFIYRTYHAGERTAKEHVGRLLDGEPGKPYAVGGSASEGQWRKEFRAGGLAVHEPPVREVEVGIDRVYGMLSQKKVAVMDDQRSLISDIEQYSRVLDERGEPTEKIEDKETWHVLDALRYLCSHLNNPGAGGAIGGNWTL